MHINRDKSTPGCRKSDWNIPKNADEKFPIVISMVDMKIG